jgi:hypothetical protein
VGAFCPHGAHTEGVGVVVVGKETGLMGRAHSAEARARGETDTTLTGRARCVESESACAVEGSGVDMLTPPG